MRSEDNIALAEKYFKEKKDEKRLLTNFGFHTMIAEMTRNPIIILTNKLIHDLLYDFFDNLKPSVAMT
jgi:DNA-binding FadR family transcriptional regulator